MEQGAVPSADGVHGVNTGMVDATSNELTPINHALSVVFPKLT